MKTFLRRLARPFALLSLLTVASVAQAAPKMSGSYRYAFDATGRNVTISIEKIANTSAQNATANLMVKLWAMDTPYNGGSLTGHTIGSFPLEGIHPGRQYANLNKTVPYVAPPALRDYFICITVSEYSDGAYRIVDWGNLPSQKRLGPVKLFSLEGPWSWKSSYPGGTVDINVAKVSHTRNGNTGSLRLELWASPHPWNGGAMPGGVRIGVVEKPALQQNYNYTNVSNVGKFYPPPDGFWYVALCLYEYQGDGYKFVGHLPASSGTPFKRP